MEFNNSNFTTQFLENRSILVTGATGFLAKIFVEKILRVQPKVKKLYLLIRAADAKSASERFQNEVIGKDLFKVLKDKLGKDLNTFIMDKISVVHGDVTYENLGVKNIELLEEIYREVDVVVNVAATTNFDERYDVALHLNTLGAKNVLNFARKCTKLQIVLHVSTAYVSGEKAGLILESPYEMGKSLNGAPGLNIDTERKVIEETLKELRDRDATDKETTLAMKDLGIQRAKKYGWPNTYVFTKAMGEMLLGRLKENIPLVIVRPTIITSTYKEPFPGWVEGVRTIDSLIVGYGKGRLTCFLGDPESILDLIPADFVVNLMIVAMASHANRAIDDYIYHIGSSVANPITIKCFQDCTQRYFMKHPLIGKDGRPVKVDNCTVLSSMASFRRYMSIRYLFPLKGLELVNTAFCHSFQGTYSDLSRKIKFVMRLVDLYRPYVFFNGTFDDTNTEKLQIAAGKSADTNGDMFYFDPRVIDWSDYFMKIHFNGIIKYVLK